MVWIFLPIAIALAYGFYNTVMFDVFTSISFALIILFTIQYAHLLSKSKLFYATEKLGEYTYGLYMYSGMVLTVTAFIGIRFSPLISFLIHLILVIIVSILSYHLYEKHFLKLKSRFRKRA